MTEGGVLAHLRQRLPAFRPAGAPQRLTGGLLNYVWRVPGQPAPVVVKHAPPHLATAPAVPLDPARLLFEARALELLGPGGVLAGVATPSVRPPRLLDLDAAAFVLVMEDVGPAPGLGDWLRTGTPGEAVGRRLGQFVGALHAQSAGRADLAARFDNQLIQRTRHAVQYRAVEAGCRRAGLPDAEALGARAEALGERLQQPGRCLIQGDLWPPSVRVTDGGLRVIDWEFAHFGHPAQDVAHLAAHLWMHAHRAASAPAEASARAVLRGFLAAYLSTLGAAAPALLGPAVAADAAIHFGAEILVRTVGAFQGGYVYEGLPPEAPAVQEAVAVAAAHLRTPEAAALFEPLRRT